MGTRHWAVALVTVAGLMAPVLGTGLAAAAPPKRVTITFTSAPTAATNGATNQRTATFAFTSNAAAATYTCSLDGARASACKSPVSLTNLKVGAHSFRVNGSATGFKPGNSTWGWTIDVTPPAAPTVTKPASPSSLSAVPVSFTGEVGATFRCSLDGAAAVTCTSPYNAVVSIDGTHSVTVRAVDKAGNVGPSTTVSWLRDTVLATPLVNSGPPSLTTATSATFTFSSNELGVTFACKLDGGAYAACNTGTVSYSALSSSNGGVSHSFTVRGTDAAGNVATSDVCSWTVKNAVSISLSWSTPAGLPSAVTNQTGATFDFATTGSPAVTCNIDGGPWAACTSPLTYSSLSEGPHVVVVSAIGGLPTTTVTQTYRWQVDTTAPAPPTVDGPTGTVASTSANLQVTPGEPGNTVACTVDGGAVSCAGTVSLTGLAQGAHQLVAVGSDAAGNTASTSHDWAVDTLGPAATVTVPSTLTAAALVTFDEDASGVATDSVALQLADGSPVVTSMICTNAGSVSVGCGGSGVRKVSLRPAAALLAGEYYQVVVNPVAAPTVTDGVANVAGAVTQAFRGALLQQESSPAAIYTWRLVKTAKGKGGSYLVERRKGASVSYAFSGRSISWVGVKGPTFGWADVYVDGVRKGSFNNWSKRSGYGVTRTVKGLSPGTHTVKVVAKGKKGNRGAKDTLVAVDGFKVGTKLNATPKVKSGWQRAGSSKASGGAYAVASLKGQSVSLRFRGTAITWRTVTGPGFGKALVLVDGVKVATVDNWSKTTLVGVQRSVGGLTDAVHTLKLVVSGTKNTRATGTALAIDSWTVS